jgi:glycosyltransferase involved in cell wall biosynthesis
VPGETGLLVPSKNAPALAEAVAKLLENPVLATSMGSAGRERAVNLYDERVVARHFTDFINDNYGRSWNGQTHF